MKPLRYLSGEEITAGDRITYHRESGEVDFVVKDVTGDPERDWFLSQYPEGGVMLRVDGMGNVFLGAEDLEGDEDLKFLSRL